MSVKKDAGRWRYRVVVKLPDGAKVRISGTPTVNTRDHALRAEREHVERAIDDAIMAKHAPPIIEAKPLAPTLAEYLDGWIARRRELGLVTVDNDETRVRLHALPHIGTMRLDEVKPRHLRDLILALRSGGKLAPRTILKTSATLHSLFNSAVVEELIVANPVVYEPGTLPKKADKDPEWRHQAIYTRDEIQSLLSDDRIPADRRMLYGLKTLAALRHAEAANLTWSMVDATTEPLGRINLGKTKSGVPRAVPVHPTLAKMLATWKLAGWFNTYGRQPRPEDLIVPALTMKARAPKEAQDALVGDLAMLGLRVEAGKRMNRRGHDMRRTLVSIAQADGARRDVLEWGTHGPRGDIMSMYTTLPWATLCEEWSKIRIVLLDGALVSLRHENPSALTLRARRRWQPPAVATAWQGVENAAQAVGIVVTPKGLEPLFSP